MVDSYNREVLKVKRLSSHSPIFISRKAGRISHRQVRNITQKHLGVSPHVIRHTTFTELRKKGVIGEVIQKLAGHSNYNITVKYYLSIEPEDMMEAVR